MGRRGKLENATGAELKDLISKAEQAGIEADFMEQARTRMKESEAIQAMDDALKENTVDALEKAIQLARDVGVTKGFKYEAADDALAKAKIIQDVKSALRSATEKGDSRRL